VVDAVEALPPGAGAGPGGSGASVEPLDDAGRAAYDALAGELGDLLYQVVFHAVLAQEAGAFDFADVARAIHEKLVRRHPHVFGTVEAGTSAEVVRNWEQIKTEERASESIVDGIPKGLPALIYEHKILRKAASIGLAAPGAVPADLPAGLADLDRATGRLRDASGAEGGVDGAATEAEPAAAVGEVLAATVAVALALGVDGESALHARSGRFLARFRAMEDPRRRRGRRPPRRRPGDRRRPVAPRRLWAPLLGSGARGRYLHADARPACSSRPDARRLGRRRFVARPGGNTPLVRLGRVGADLECDLIAKVEQFNPGGSVKDRPAIAMVDAAEREGLLEPGGTIVEPTSGNTGVGLALVAAQRGYRCIFVMSDKMSEEKVALLRAYGAEVVVCPTAVPPEHPDSYYSVADRLTRETPNAFRPDQYSNPHNPDEHERSTGPEIWRQTAGRITQSGRGGHGRHVTGWPVPQRR